MRLSNVAIGAVVVTETGWALWCYAHDRPYMAMFTAVTTGLYMGAWLTLRDRTRTVVLPLEDPDDEF
jgi:hypothetical protein